MAKAKKFDYFDAFERLSELACEEARLLVTAIDKFESLESIRDTADAAHELEHDGDVLNHMVHNSIAVDFVTPIEREDLINLSHALDNILDSIEDVMRQFYMFNVSEMHPKALIFSTLILLSCEALQTAMEDFRNYKRSKKFRELLIEVSNHEEEADKLYMEVIHEMFSAENPDPMYVMVWREIYRRMEQCCDACEHVADAMYGIVLKNS